MPSLKEQVKPASFLILLAVLFAVLLSFSAFSDGTNTSSSANQTINSTSQVNDTSPINPTVNQSVNQTINQSDSQNQWQNITANQTEGQINQTEEINRTEEQLNQTEEQPVFDFSLTGFTPDKAAVGDVMLTIQLQNTGNTALKELIPIIVGRGFSTYDITPFPSLEPGEKAEAYITGYLSESGNIILTIKIGEKIFYKKIAVEEPAANETKEEKNEGQEATVSLLSSQLEKIRKDYSSLQDNLNSKKNDYDVSSVNLDQLKKYVRDAESALASDGLDRANVSIILATNEYNDQKRILSSSPKKPYLARIREEILIFSTIAGAIITLFTFYEIMKKKQETVYKKIKEFKVTKDTKVVVERKQEEHEEQEEEAGRDEEQEINIGEEEQDLGKEDTIEENKVESIKEGNKKWQEEEKGKYMGTSDEEILKSDKPLKQLFDEYSKR